MSIERLGNRMKVYESTDKFIPFLPIIVRLDGRCFHRFTKGLEKPYSKAFIKSMAEVTKALVNETNAKLGYTQSDEISLLIQEQEVNKQVYFDGKKQKIISVLASLCTDKFRQARLNNLPGFKTECSALFDCRAFNLPNTNEVINYFTWRELDATKNALSSAARQVANYIELHGKDKTFQHELLMRNGINFNNYPAYFKRGIYIKRITEYRELTENEMENIPYEYQPQGPVERRSIKYLRVPPINKLTLRQQKRLIS